MIHPVGALSANGMNISPFFRKESVAAKPKGVTDASGVKFFKSCSESFSQGNDMALVELNAIAKRYQMGEVTINALKNVNLEIERKTFVSIIGPSGSGKSTLLNLIGCLDQPTEGSVSINGEDVGKIDRVARARFRGEHLGFVFQNFNLIPVLTVYENVEYPLLMVKNRKSKKDREKVLQVLEAVGVLDQKNKLPSQISGGQQQRVAVARALVTEPKLVIADEPTANLDHDTAHRIIALMKQMKDQWDTTFVFSTHDPKIIGEAEVIHTMEDGMLVNREDMRKS